MGTAFLATGLLVAVFVFLWARRAQRARARWLRQLALPGTWVMQALAADPAKSEDGPSIAPIVLGRLQLEGDLTQGRYRLQLDRNGRWREYWTSDVELEEGAWQLDGSVLEFRSLQDHVRRFELRLLTPGSLGLRGQDTTQGYYAMQRETNNVVELPRRAQSGN